MDYKTMKNSHEVQIKALLEGNYDTFKAEFSGPNFNPDLRNFKPNHHSAWGYTRGHPHSLFGCLPESDRCLTQIKHQPEDSIWYGILGLKNNDLIPTTMTELTVLSEAQLREFSRLQLLANFPEKVT